MPSLVEDLEFRGLVADAAGAGLQDALGRGGMTAYIGFDPTSSSLHVGNLVVVLMLRRLQLHGHRPIAVAGGATAMIGDPGGKSEERPLLSEEEVKANVAGVRAQLDRLLDAPSSGDAHSAPLVLDNREWLGGLGLLGFLRDVGKHFTVNQMLAKESVRARVERPEHGISFTEFSYMLLQALDYLHLFDEYGCRLQMGGSDQWGNITAGIDFVRRARQQEVYGLVTPLLVKADGTKFGKTESGTVWLDPDRTSPYELYQFLFRTDDKLVGECLRYLTFIDHDRITDLDRATAQHPERREAQRALADSVCSLVHGDAETDRARRAAAALYDGHIESLDEPLLLQVFAEAPRSTWARAELDGDGPSLVDALARSGLVRSKSEARGLIAQGGAYVNGKRVRDIDARLGRDELLFDRYVVLQKGRDYHLVRFE
ncbi:MAG TPA: tyrosine--tRNA ligase [Acidimicrobiales bacterium]|nr:tyrosine--tRNA ligase [Acidimicrobiales bacterium]